LLEEAEKVLSTVISRKCESIYDHQNQIKGTAYHFNCYGFVDYLLERVSPPARIVLHQRMCEMAPKVPPSWDGIPCPFNLFAIFQSLRKQPTELWSSVDFLDIKSGDILTYQPPNYTPPKEPDFSKPPPMHVVIIQKVWHKESDWVHLQVIDSTRKPHNSSDSRFPDNSGIGCSELFIRFQPSDKIYEIRWHQDAGWCEKAISVGRLNLENQ